MSAFTLKASTTQPLTPALAEQFRGLPASPTEREFNERRAEDLREKFENGLATSFHWVTAELDGQVWRMNGQHSSAVLCGMDGAFPKGAMVHMDEWLVADKFALALLFRQYDNRMSARSSLDVSGAYQKLHDDIRDLDRELCKVLIEGVHWHRQHVDKMEVVTNDDQYQLFNVDETHPFLKWGAVECLNVKTPEMRKKPVCAAMWGSFNLDEAGAKAFWTEVARGGKQDDDTDPAAVLDGWLRKLIGKHKEERTPHQVYTGCANAWNAYKAGRPLKRVSFDTLKGLPPLVG